jgi:hypothetical protein
VAKTRAIFQRACTHHLDTKVSLHLAWSAFEEELHNLDAAIQVSIYEPLFYFSIDFKSLLFGIFIFFLILKFFVQSSIQNK